MRPHTFFAAGIACLSSAVHAINLDLSSEQSIKSAASQVAWTMVNQYYIGNETGQTPGMLIEPNFYWWLCGAMFGTLMDYWYYTGDSSYNALVTQGMLFQASPSLDFMPSNQTSVEGNDDQVFWGFSAMTAAEYKFPNPPADQPQWLELAQGVWNSQALRWDNICAGGLRWQIFPLNNGYTYKNSVANGGFMNLGARLYAYTGNQTYGHWAEKVWTWMEDVQFIGSRQYGTPGYSVFDGASTGSNCTDRDPVQWTYTAGMVLNAAAVMWNVTQDPIWEQRAFGVWNASLVFFPKGEKIMVEVACEYNNNCDLDQQSFKTYLTRFMAASTKWMPQLCDAVMPYITASAQAAAEQCSGTVDQYQGNVCGLNWADKSKFDGNYGPGQQMAALEVIQANLLPQAAFPLTAKTGGTSKGNPSAGSSGDTTTAAPPLQTITTGDKAGAGVLTAIVLLIFLGGTWWIVV